MASTSDSLAYKLMGGLALLSAAMALIAVGGQNWGLAIWGSVLAAGLGLGSRALRPKVAELSLPARAPRSVDADDGSTRVYFGTTPRDGRLEEDTAEDEDDDSAEPSLQEAFAENVEVHPIDALFEWLNASQGQWPSDALEQVKTLAAAVTDFSETDNEGDFVFDAAALLDAPQDVLTFLLPTRIKPEGEDFLFSRVLDADPDLATVQFLLANGFDANSPSESYESLLEQTIEEDMDDSFALALLDAGARPTTTLQEEDVLTYVVGSNATHAVLESMLEKGYSPNPENANPLMVALENDDALSVELLLHHGANPFARDDNDQTALQVVLEGDSDPVTLARLLGAVDAKRQQRGLGWIEASGGEDSDVVAVEEHLACLEQLQQAWTTGTGYGDPWQARPRATGAGQDTLDATLLQHTDDILKVQNLILLGANPLATPRGQTSALDTALGNEDPLIVAVMLESLTDAEAQAWLDQVDNNASYAVALRLRRAQRMRFWTQTHPDLPPPGSNRLRRNQGVQKPTDAAPSNAEPGGDLS